MDAEVEIEDFRFIQKLGKGAFGSIWKAQSICNKKIYAIKIYKKDERTENIEALEDSSEIALGLKHPNLMECYTFFHDRIVTETNTLRGVSSVHLFTVLEFIPGKDLESMIRETGKIKEGEMDIYLPQITSALIYLHSQKVIHRDFKPSNVMISPDNQIKIVDYDFLARLNENLTKKVGTPYYLAPELFSQKTYDEKVDLWALGITLFYALTGNLPFDANDKKELKNLVLSNYEPDYLDLSPKYSDICRGLLTKDPKNRLNLEEIQGMFKEEKEK